MEIYFEKNGRKIGPINVSEIDSNTITSDTLIWHKGLENWTKASEIPDLTTYFKSLPPPLPVTEDSEIYDLVYEKDYDATWGGVFLLLANLGIYFFLVNFPYQAEKLEDKLFFLLFFGPILRFGIAFMIRRIAKEQNRNHGAWFIFGLILPTISLLIIGQLRKLKNKSKYERELDEYEKENKL